MGVIIMMFTSLNRNTNNKLFDVTIENPQYRKLSDFVGMKLRVDGMYINTKSKFGDEPIFIVFTGDSHYFVHLPKSHLETIKTITSNSEMVAGVNNHECYIEVVSYHSKRFDKVCNDIVFIEKPAESLQSLNNWTPPTETQEDIF